VVTVVVMISKGKAIRLIAVLMLVLLVALPISSAYLNPSPDMTEFAEEKSCYCHGAETTIDVDITVDVDLEVAYTPENETVNVEVAILGQPTNYTGFAIFLNASKDSSDVKWTTRFSDGTIDVPNGEIDGIIRVNKTSIWTTGPVVSPYFNVSFIPGQVDQDIILSVTGMRADNSSDEVGDLWNVAEATIEVRRQRLVNLTVGVTNDEDVSVTDVLVDFYIDDEYVGNDTIENIKGGGMENATVAWDATFMKNGKYKLRAVIDPLEHVTEIDKSNNEVTRTIYLGGPPAEEDLTIYYGLASLAVGVVVIVGVFYLWRRRQYRF
jgi:hypothetical protein